eukprot:Transcript_5859.p2 GENE.Transcript_5859~~Transcript_5859.p2  ORF type:complete len:251 (-),score=31.65 Transcript_5859:1105-1857(-)
MSEPMFLSIAPGAARRAADHSVFGLKLLWSHWQHGRHDDSLTPGAIVLSPQPLKGGDGHNLTADLRSLQLDYQLMEHWAPSLDELVAMEQQEAEVDAVRAPQEHQSRFSIEASEMMQQDVLQKMKELVALHKAGLAEHLVTQDPDNSGEVSDVALVAGLRDVVHAALPWHDFVRDLASVDSAGRVRYHDFLARYRVDSVDAAWQSRVLASLYSQLCEKDLSGTLAFFDTNQDGQVTKAELAQVRTRASSF